MGNLLDKNQCVSEEMFDNLSMHTYSCFSLYLVSTIFCEAQGLLGVSIHLENDFRFFCSSQISSLYLLKLFWVLKRLRSAVGLQDF